MSKQEREVTDLQEFMSSALVTDMCLPGCPKHMFYPSDSEFFSTLERYVDAGVNFVTLTVGLDHFPSIEATIKDIAAYHAAIEARPDLFHLVRTYADIEKARSMGKLGVGMHFQGTNPLGGDLNMVGLFRKLGIGHMLLAYNARNATGDGCHEKENAGLSLFGRMLVQRMNTEKVIVDLTHTGERTSLEASELSTQPVIYSHSSVRALFDHERNITDSQIKACAATGGVIGVTGVGVFMSEQGADISPEVIATHIMYISDLVGAQHAGFGLDYVADIGELISMVNNSPDKYPQDNPNYTKSEYAFAGPEVIEPIAEILLKENYREDQVKGILGENFARVMKKVWQN